ncbi:MAG: hypothetical protein AAF351_00290 [Pseudomonadota bacterium]
MINVVSGLSTRVRAEILDKAPLSGVFTEVEYDARGDCLWVKFTEDDLTEWCGVFGQGGFNVNEVLVHNRLNQVLVIAGGVGYWVDLNTRELIGEIDLFPTLTAIWPDELDFAILANWTNVFFASGSEQLWRSERVSLDDLSVDSYSDRVVHGRGYDTGFKQFRFSINVDSREVRGIPEDIRELGRLLGRM